MPDTYYTGKYMLLQFFPFVQSSVTLVDCVEMNQRLETVVIVQ